MPQDETSRAALPRRPQPPRRRGQVFSSFAHRDFRYLLTGTFLTQVGQWTQQIGQGWLVFELTESTFQLGVVVLFLGGAMLIFAPIGGALADRYDRTRLMFISQGFLMSAGLLLAILVVTDLIVLWHIYLASFMTGASFAVNGPARQSLVYDIVGERDLANAVALNSLAMSSMRVVGPSIGGAMLGTVGVEGTFFFQPGCYVGGMILALMLRIRPKGSMHRPPFLRSLADGVRYARANRTILLLLVTSTVSALFGMAYIHLMPAYAGDVLDLGGSGFGYLMMAQGVGGMIGAGAIVYAGDLPGKGRVFMLAIALMGGLLLVLAGVPVIPIAVLSLVGLGVGSTLVFSLGNTLIQLNVDDEYRGRIMSLYFMTFGLQPLGVVVFGGLAELLDLRISFALLGAIVLSAVAAIAVFSPRVRSLQ